MAVTEEINQFITEEGKGSTRDALNVALTKLDLEQREVAHLRQQLAEVQARGVQLYNTLNRCGMHTAECVICEPPHEGCDCGLDRALAVRPDGTQPAALSSLLSQRDDAWREAVKDFCASLGGPPVAIAGVTDPDVARVLLEQAVDGVREAHNELHETAGSLIYHIWHAAESGEVLTGQAAEYVEKLGALLQAQAALKGESDE